MDTCIVNDNIWLVLVFHGINGIGWETKTGAELEEYFSYMKEKEDDLWIATFADVTKYVRERKSAVINSEVGDDNVVVNVTSDLDPEVYNIPITLKTYVPSTWESATLNEGNQLKLKQDDQGTFVLYSVIPNDGEIILTEQI